MVKTLHENGIDIKEVQYCSHTPQENCTCRKPETGMIDEILKHYDINLEKSWMIGDKQSDIDFAYNAKIGHTIAIGDRPIKDANYFFDSISQCKHYLEKNQDIIKL